jgi:hypothetical protein
VAGLDPARPNRLDGTILPQVAAQVLATLEASREGMEVRRWSSVTRSCEHEGHAQN